MLALTFVKLSNQNNASKALKTGILLLFFWLVAILIMGAWWSYLILNQSQEIINLRTSLGEHSYELVEKFTRTKRMILGESLTFFILLSGSTLGLATIFFRDFKRTLALQNFFASLTHELRTPLASIRLQSEALLSLKPEVIPKLIKRLAEDTEKLEHQVEKTLALARVNSNGKVFSKPTQLIPTTEKILLKSLESETNKINLKINFEPYSIYADVHSLTIIFRNIIENAIKHSKVKNPTLTVLSLRRDEFIEIALQNNGALSQLSTGKMGQLFEKGYQSAGAGLGLYLIRSLMEQQGGQAVFKNTEDNSGFSVHLFFKEASIDDRGDS